MWVSGDGCLANILLIKEYEIITNDNDMALNAGRVSTQYRRTIYQVLRLWIVVSVRCFTCTNIFCLSLSSRKPSISHLTYLL